MQCPSLPTECLAHIFSFSDYSTISNCRLACREFNQIIKNYKIQKLRVKSININWIDSKNTILINIIPLPTEYEELVFGLNARKRKLRYRISETQSIQQTLKTFLTKIEHSENVYFCDFDVNDSFLLISQKFGDRFGNCKNLIFNRCSFSLSTLYMKYLIQVIEPKKVHFRCCNFPNTEIVSAKCLPATPVIMQSINHPVDKGSFLSIDDSYLEAFGDRIYDVSFNFDSYITGFSFHTVRKLVNERLDRGKYNGLWNFGILKFGNWRMLGYTNFCEYYRDSKYYCRHSIGSETADVWFYIPRRFAGLENVDGCSIIIHFQLKETTNE